MNDKIRNFRDLKIWQNGIEIVKDIYSYLRSFPEEEKCALTSQIRRSSVSIPSNIAEGFNRYHNKEYRQFLYVSLGSLAELETQIERARAVEYIKQKNYEQLLDKITLESKMIRSLIKKL